jgi:hypothetical protein
MKPCETTIDRTRLSRPELPNKLMQPTSASALNSVESGTPLMVQWKVG